MICLQRIRQPGIYLFCFFLLLRQRASRYVNLRQWCNHHVHFSHHVSLPVELFAQNLFFFGRRQSRSHLRFSSSHSARALWPLIKSNSQTSRRVLVQRSRQGVCACTSVQPRAMTATSARSWTAENFMLLGRCACESENGGMGMRDQFDGVW